ncbi:MAG: nickel-dependent lactate racemase [Calditrichaeota bacterium]|nr:nickel-dependent lactate racemase [Calditrichota bacterium]
MEFPFGDRFVNVILPNGWHFNTIEAPQIRRSSDSPRELIQKALLSPVDFPCFDEYFSGKVRILVVVPDNTRPCPLPDILPLVLNHLARVGSESITVITANGTHLPMSEAVLRQHVGASTFDSFRVIQHDASSREMREVGKTRRGTCVAVNRVLFEADAVLAISPVQHHYFAGMGGGPKLIVPGLASAETAFQNHRLSIAEDGRMHPNCREGILHGNPVAEDIYEAMSFCPPIFFLGLILDAKGRIADALAGDIYPTHETLARKYHGTHTYLVKERRPLVVASAGGIPRDRNFIQAHRGMHRAARVVEKGGTLIFLAECIEGLGSTTLLPWLEAPTSSEIASKLLQNYTLHGHTALALREKTEKARIFLLSNLEPDVVSRLGMTALSSGIYKPLNINELMSKLSPSEGWLLPQAAEFLPLPIDEKRPEDHEAMHSEGVEIL